MVLANIFLDQFFSFNLKEVNPLLLHVALSTSIISIFDNISGRTASWLMDVHRVTIELSMNVGLLPNNNSRTFLSPSELKIFNQIPQSLSTAIGWLNIDPNLITMNCCSKCFAMYPIKAAPEVCTHRVASIPGGPADPSGLTQNNPTKAAPEPFEPDLSETTCLGPLLKFSRGKMIPIRKYAVQDLAHWIARFFSRPKVEDWLDESLFESRKPFNKDASISDIHESRIWKEFKGPDGQQFTARSGNLVFAMFVDAINPFGNKASGHHVSITFVVLVCLTLPVTLRHRPENIFLVGIAPGPREPSLEQMNWILLPLVTQLQNIWSPGLLLARTHSCPRGRLVRAALIPFIADIPSLRRSLGFPSARARYFCSCCHLINKEIENLDPQSWRIRTKEEHKIWAHEARDAETVEERQTIFETHGVRYSVMVELDYWNIIDFHVVDSMHNLLLGLLAWHLRRFWSMKDVKNEEQIQQPVSTSELFQLLKEHSHPLPPKNYAKAAEKPDESEEGEMDEETLSSHTSTSDEDFDPLANVGWKGVWEAPPMDEIIIDGSMLSIINGFLPRIQIPSWIKRAIPVLGKASFGKLKADEWRNIFTIQLPLILIPLWAGKDQIKLSLLKKFCDLVLLVNLALKRSISRAQIDKYRMHIQNYLEGSLVLFTHCSLAPNHHMAIHLADCLERFGPVRLWWSFPFERLMGSILKACHNNHVGK